MQYVGMYFTVNKKEEHNNTTFEERNQATGHHGEKEKGSY